MDLFGHRCDLGWNTFFRPQLNDINATVDHRRRDPDDICALDVTKIENAVEPTAVETSHDSDYQRQTAALPAS
jgi:hypothetical protein